MGKTITVKGISNRGQRFLVCRKLEDLARLLGKPALSLMAMAEFPQYNEFSLPKKNGGRRQIEDPVPTLKKVHRKLNDYLQGVYYLHRPQSAFGFVTNPVDDPAPRHILSNAQMHMGCQWLLNVDVKDFFHQITIERVVTLFRDAPFRFKKGIAVLLAELCTYRGRLPMGAPTSPIISNLVAIDLDHDLEAFADQHAMMYTRYADDFTFSAKQEITSSHLEQIRGILHRYNFALNPTKMKWYSPKDDDKEVTGLIVREERIDLPHDYLSQLGEAINHLDQIIDAKYSTPSGRSDKAKWIEELEEQIRGKLEYARQILGEFDLQYQDLVIQMEEALSPPEHYGPMSWLDFGYSLPQ